MELRRYGKDQNTTVLRARVTPGRHALLLRFDALHAQLLIDDQPVFDAALPTPPALSRVGIGVKGGRVTLRRWHVTPEP